MDDEARQLSTPRIAEFWARVKKADSGCWLWLGKPDRQGYGKFTAWRKDEYAHRVAWALTNGPIADGARIRHTCESRMCVNPDHLLLAAADASGPEHTAWINMIQRCENPRLPFWHRYGGRGIKVCERWRQSFDAFFADVGRRPSDAHSLDRYPDSDGNYEPGNVRWATWREQQRNRSNNRKIQAFGETRCVAEWADDIGVARSTISVRLRAGDSGEESLRPTEKPMVASLPDGTVTMAQLSTQTGVPLTSLYRRMRRHDGDVDRAVLEWKNNRIGKKKAS